MKLIFIRHGEPDYINDCLTENGRKEAKALAMRIKDWNVTQFFVSPQGRAQETASYSLKECNREAVCLDFLHEFSYKVEDPVTGRIGVPWDFVASDWTKNDYMFELEDGFLKYPCIASNEEIKIKYDEAVTGFDNLLKDYGYIREGRFYRNINAEKRYLKSTVGPDNKIRNNGKHSDGSPETTLVFFCHLGISCLIMSHLMNIPFETLTHGLYMAPTSITVLTAEERWDNEAYFRAQAIGDTVHLHKAGLPVSFAGSFADPFLG